METLTENMIIEIFKHLSFIDICNLLLTCKHFNKIISNSSVLLKQFRFKCTTDESWLPTRKYQNVLIDRHDEKMLKYLNSNGNCIQKMFIENNLKMEMLTRILKKTPNLKHLSLNCIKLEVTKEGINEPFPNLKLHSLNINCLNDVKTLNFLAQSSAVNINIEIYFDEEEEADKYTTINGICKFLKQQKKLKHLEIDLHGRLMKLFDFNPIVDVDFKLTKFKLKFYDSFNFDKIGLINFLKNQNNLHEICLYSEIGFIDFETKLTFLRNFSNLKTLYFKGIKLDVQPMSYVENLTLDCFTFTPDFRATFPNVKKANIFILCNELEDVHLIHLKLPMHVEKLTFSTTHFQQGAYPFDLHYMEIDYLIFFRCENIEWLFDSLKSNKIKIKSLKLQFTTISKSQYEYLKSLRQKKVLYEIDIDVKSRYYEYLLGDDQ